VDHIGLKCSMCHRGISTKLASAMMCCMPWHDSCPNEGATMTSGIMWLGVALPIVTHKQGSSQWLTPQFTLFWAPKISHTT
jgi:hypothetical protein